jgi:hypothetical protein
MKVSPYGSEKHSKGLTGNSVGKSRGGVVDSIGQSVLKRIKPVADGILRTLQIIRLAEYRDSTRHLPKQENYQLRRC